MKRAISIITLVLLLGLGSGIAFGQDISITSETKNMVPGGTGYLIISISNKGTSNAYEAGIALTSLDSPLDSNYLCSSCLTYDSMRKVCLEYAPGCFFTLGDIHGGDSKEITIPIDIPSGTNTGYFFAGLVFKSDDSYGDTSYLDYTQALKVDSPEEKVRITSVEVSPSSVNIGQPFNLTLTLDNNGVLDVRNLVLSISSDEIKTYNSLDKVYIDRIAGGSSKEVAISMIADAYSTPGAHEIDFNLQYAEGDEMKNYSSSFGLLVGTDSKVDVSVQGTSVTTTENSDGTTSSQISVTMNIANTGIMDLSSFNIQLMPGEDFVTSGESSDFIGSLNAGDFETASFSIVPLVNMSFQRNPGDRENMTTGNFSSVENRMGNVTLVFDISYTTVSGERVEKEVTQTVDMGSLRTTLSGTASQAFRSFSRSTTSSFDWAGILSVVFICVVSGALVFFFWRSKAKKKRR
jgi:hypothetical protein